ncbi:hypothetical protein KTR66_07795 [Roseococcus sp. SDR]|uniref:hypothetical protein n=1 Tax=Roseococcus sp. SDR TaxID=2835532 RepID=UPI001BCC05A7|nr:hypothetical protein [Roseococcus sp. SDR]MBS7789892.1 hypothetical protein [Roseococcus sp. SDR]MBV1845206.1 hypothetical protein [Roseococcus sp. SDR]
MNDDARQFDDLAEPLIQAGERVGERLTAEFELLRAMYDPEALSPRLGFARRSAPGLPMLTEDGSRWRSAPVKYAVDARSKMEKWRKFMPFLKGFEAAFEIGVGPGYLFRLMMDFYGTRMTGCDIEFEQLGVYDALRSELGIKHLIREHFVARRVSTPVTPGSEAVLAFWLAFDSERDEEGVRTGWTVEDHEWFLADIARQLSGRRQFICRFNKWWYSRENRDVMRFYRQIGVQPIAEDPRFFIVNLKSFI